MSDHLLALERAVSDLEAIDRLIQALPDGADLMHVTDLAHCFEAARERHSQVQRAAERAQALTAGRRLIPPLASDTDGGPEMTNPRWAVARGELAYDATYRPDQHGVSYIRDVLAVAMPGMNDPQYVAEATERLRRNQQEAIDVLRLTREESAKGSARRQSPSKPYASTRSGRTRTITRWTSRWR